MSEPTLAPTPILQGPTATTAEILRTVKGIILDEPKRLNLYNWITLFRGKEVSWPRDMPRPGCGTVGCIGGWCAVLLRDDDGDDPFQMKDRAMKEIADDLNIDGDLFDCEPTAWDDIDHLPKKCWRCEEDASECDCTDRDETDDEPYMGLPGTALHAKLVADRIDAYLACHSEAETHVVNVR